MSNDNANDDTETKDAPDVEVDVKVGTADETDDKPKADADD